jgi:hypothetical protein
MRDPGRKRAPGGRRLPAVRGPTRPVPSVR